jgi:hypothetical protein
MDIIFCKYSQNKMNKQQKNDGCKKCYIKTLPKRLLIYIANFFANTENKTIDKSIAIMICVFFRNQN